MSPRRLPAMRRGLEPCPRTLSVAAAIAPLLAIALGTLARAEDLAYRTVFEGVPVGVSETLLKSVSRLASLEKKGAQSGVALERRAETDRGRVRQLLHSQGYYDGLVERRIDITVRPAIVTLRIDAGERYEISRAEVRRVGATDDRRVLDAAIARFEGLTGEPAQAKRVLDAEARLLEDVEAKAFPLVNVTERSYVVDHATRSLAVVLALDTGPAARFGAVEIVGLEQVGATYVRNRLPWEDGAAYDPAAVDKGRRELAATGLFSHASIRHADRANADGTLPMTLTVVESKFRTVGLGVRYDSSLGAGGGASWEHRNVLGEGERLRLVGDIAQDGWSSALQWREPDFLRPGYTLGYRAGYEQEDTTAYDLHRADTAVGLDVPLSLVLTGTMGTSLEWTPVETKARDSGSNEREQDETFLLLGFPFALRRSTTDDILEPTRGTRVELIATPFFEVSGKDLAFVVTRITPSFYLPFEIPGLRRSVLAGRMSLGSIQGAKREATPADKRFYAGGGGSIRGYDYQRVGPLDDDNEPLGGRSLLELGTELRLRLTESFGIVGFIEGGNVYTSLYPDFDDVIRWGAGGGLRYYSAVGPLRIDVATPVNGRDGIDDPLQVYLSLGEAF